MSCEHKWIRSMKVLTIKGHYLYLYQCKLCGLFDYGIEETKQEVKEHEENCCNTNRH